MVTVYVVMLMSCVGVQPMLAPPMAPPIRVFPLADELGGKEFSWVPIPSSQGRQWALILKGKQVGAWDTVDRYYRPVLSNGEWGTSSNHAPIAPPASEVNVGYSPSFPSQTGYTLPYASSVGHLPSNSIYPAIVAGSESNCYNGTCIGNR